MVTLAQREEAAGSPTRVSAHPAVPQPDATVHGSSYKSRSCAGGHMSPLTCWVSPQWMPRRQALIWELTRESGGEEGRGEDSTGEAGRRVRGAWPRDSGYGSAPLTPRGHHPGVYGRARGAPSARGSQAGRGWGRVWGCCHLRRAGWRCL